MSDETTHSQTFYGTINDELVFRRISVKNVIPEELYVPRLERGTREGMNSLLPPFDKEG